MNATLTFRIPQSDICIWTAHTIADILDVKGKLTRSGQDWVFKKFLSHDDLEWTEDRIAADSAAFAHWQEHLRSDFDTLLGRSLTDMIEECLDIDTEEDEKEAFGEHEANYREAVGI